MVAVVLERRNFSRGVSMRCCATCLPISRGDFPSGQEPKYAAALAAVLLVLRPVQLVRARTRVKAMAVVIFEMFILLIESLAQFQAQRYSITSPEKQTRQTLLVRS